jgi:hypothetical protein
MIIERKETIDDDDGKLGVIDTIFESSNILRSIYFPKTNTLYLSFSYGQTYRYDNVDNELYENFEKADSQGKYFNSNIKNNSAIPYQRSYKLYDSEIEDTKKIISEWKEKKKNQL